MIENKSVYMDEIWKLIDIYFKDRTMIYRQNYDSFEEFIKVIIPQEI